MDVPGGDTTDVAPICRSGGVGGHTHTPIGRRGGPGLHGRTHISLSRPTELADAGEERIEQKSSNFQRAEMMYCCCVPGVSAVVVLIVCSMTPSYTVFF